MQKISLRQKICLTLFGIFLCLLLLEVGLRIGGFIALSLQEHRNAISIKQRGAYRIMCLGESTTMDGYPTYLEEILNRRNTGIVFSVINEGISGTNTSIIVSELENKVNKYHPDLVITMMGINDQGPHIPYEGAPTSKVKLLVRSLRTYKLARLLLLHIFEKAEEVGFLKPKINKLMIQELGFHLRNIESKDAYCGQINSEEKEKFLMGGIEKSPNDANTCVEIGKFYAYRGKISKAEELFKRAIELEPEKVDAYWMLAWLYQDQGKFSQSEELYNKIISINPESFWAYSQLGEIYKILGKFSQSEELFKKAIKLDPESGDTYFMLGWLYQDQRKFSQAEEVFRKALELQPECEKIYAALSTLYEEIGNYKSAEEYRRKLEELLSTRCNPVTRNNYLRLKEILDKRGIKLVCVQYPMRSIGPLKNIFRGAKDGIIFVDNQIAFRKAVKQEGFAEYFIDMFGGDFGHCTPKGNRLLAKYIADVILKEVFYR